MAGAASGSKCQRSGRKSYAQRVITMSSGSRPMPEHTPAPPLPPLDLLRGLFAYNPLTGDIRYLQQRGPRSPGEPAGATVRGVPRLYVNGAYHRAAAVAWALHHGVDPAPQHVIPANGSPMNLQLSNLRLSPTPYTRSNRSTGRPKRRPAWVRRHIRYSQERGAWLAWHKKRLLGEYDSLHEAMDAKQTAVRQQEEQDNQSEHDQGQEEE